MIAICKTASLSSLFIHAPRVGGCCSPCPSAAISSITGIPVKHHPVNALYCAEVLFAFPAMHAAIIHWCLD